ncbi:hypothetical protein PT2222_130266 [Paraburkholderia tropica]
MKNDINVYSHFIFAPLTFTSIEE